MKKRTNKTNDLILSRKEIMEIYGVLKKLSTINIETVGIRLLYKLAKLKKTLESEIVNFEDLRNKIINLISPYEEERDKLCRELAEKDENGNPIIENNQYKITDQKLFEEKISELKDKYREILKLYDEKLKELDEFLNEEISLNLDKIKLSELPDKLPISMYDMEILYKIIEDDK